MRKIIYLILSIVFLITVSGCKNNAHSKVDKNNQVNLVKKTEDLSISPVKITDDHDQGKSKIIKIKFKIKNNSKAKKVVAANDFIIKSGESYYYMGEGINFAKTIKSHSKSQGIGYYKIPKELNKFTLMYRPEDSKETIKWKIIIKN